MTSKTISQLTDVGAALADDDLIEIETAAGNSRKAALSRINSKVAPDIAAQAYANLIINPQFSVAQRGTTFDSTTTPANNDDTYLLDRWILLSDGNDTVDVSQETTTVPDGAFTAIKLDVETANKKFAIFQPLEQKDCASLVGGVVSASFEARAGGSNATVDKLRAAIISWQGTADSITSDVVSSWGAEGANPTLATNWTYESTPADLTLTTSFQQFTIENASIDTASTKQFGLLIWCDNSDGTVADTVFIGNVQMVEGAQAPSQFLARNYQLETAMCRRYCQVIGTEAAYQGFGTGVAATSTNIYIVMHLDKMRVVPALSVSSASHFACQTGAAFVQATTLNLTHGATDYVLLTAECAGGLTAGNGGILQGYNSTSAKLTFTAEL